MRPEKKYQKIGNELDRIVRAELNFRAGSSNKKKDLSKISDTIEVKNRQIVEVHQRGTTADILPTLLSGYLQTREGGALYSTPEGVGKNAFADYTHKKGRFETLFSAAVMAMDDRELVDIVNEKRQVFEVNHAKLKDLMQLLDTVRRIQTEADMSIAESPGIEKKAISYLMELAPLKADLQAIEGQCVELKEDPYLRDAVQQLQQAVHKASGRIAEKSRKSAKFLFDHASGVFHSYKVTPAEIPQLERFMAQKDELERYAGIFDSLGDQERRDRIQGFVTTIEGTLAKLQQEVERQKAEETRATEKHQQEVSDAYQRFLEIKEMYSQGQLSAESQQKNAGEKLKKYRDTLIANGQRIMARDIERFINATGIGKPRPRPARKSGEEDTFDYKKGFLILLPITIVLAWIVLAMMVL